MFRNFTEVVLGWRPQSFLSTSAQESVFDELDHLKPGALHGVHWRALETHALKAGVIARIPAKRVQASSRGANA
jgi:hypothetical protein